MIASRTQNGCSKRRIKVISPRSAAGRRSHMDGALADRKRSFLDSLGTGWMSMTGAVEILRSSTKLHQYGCFVDHFARFSPDNMDTEHAISLRIRENLDETFRGLIHLGTAVCGKWKLTDGISDAGLLQLFLGLADRGNLGRGIHNTWDNVVVHVSRLARHDFRDRNTFILGLVREHGARDHIADRIDALHAGREMRINLHAAAIVERNAGLLQPEAFGIGHAPDADQHDIGFDRFGRTARRGLDLGDEPVA